MRQLGEHLYLVEDTCNVYLVTGPSGAVAVDFGSGQVLKELPQVGATGLGDVLVTHHHRDQVQGVARALAQGARLWVPHQEQDLFGGVAAHWQARELYNSYNNRQDRFSLLEAVQPTGTLKDYAERVFGGVAFRVLPTPGHTPGSLSLLAELDGRRLAFTGDLIAAPGKLWSLAATQWSYNGAEGAAASLASLLELKAFAPDLLLPSHGQVMPQPEEAIDLLIERLWALLQARGENKRLFALRETPYIALTPHLLWNRTSLAYGYVLLSQTGKALLIDYGYDFMTGQAVGSDRASRRPWLYSLPALGRDFGVTRIEAVIPTHYHDDHVAGFNLLREVRGAEVWAAEGFADILERPWQRDLPCLWYDPIPVDRRLPLAQPFRWEEYELSLHPLPGHTAHAVAVRFEVDGKRVVAVGDQYQNGAEAQWNYVYANGFQAGDYERTAALLRQLEPDLVLTGHWEPYWVEAGYLGRLEERGRTLSRLHHDLLLPVGALEGGPERLARLEPYQPSVRVGESVVMKAQVRNPFDRPLCAQLALVAPSDWTVSPEAADLELGSLASGAVAFSLTPSHPARRARVGLELSLGDLKLGQIAEALVSAGEELVPP